MKKNKSANKNF